jgi:hypothetical protein
VVQGLEEELAVEGVAVGWVDHLPLGQGEFVFAPIPGVKMKFLMLPVNPVTK